MENETVASKLKQKLATGEITQEEYDELMSKFENLDLLDSKVKGKRQNYKFTGAGTIDGGEVSEPIKVSGRLLSTDSLSCPSVKVSGKLDVHGDLTVLEFAHISGKLDVAGKGKFGGSFKLSGKGEFGDSIYFTDFAKISGHIESKASILSDSPIKISGKILASDVQSSSSVKLSGKVMTSEGVEAEEFISSGGSSVIGGSLKAERVEIAKRWRIDRIEEPEMEDHDFDQMESIGELGAFISNMVTKFVPKVINSVIGQSHTRGSPPKIFTIESNVEGKKVDLSYTHVKGDIIADDVLIGPEVTVDGKIKYRQSITIPEGRKYETELITS